MEVILFGRGSESLLAGFDSAGIAYERWIPKPWQIMNAGFWARVDEGASPVALAGALAGWLQSGDSRKIVLRQHDNTLVDIHGMNAEEVEATLPLCRNIMATERQKPDVTMN